MYRKLKGHVGYVHNIQGGYFVLDIIVQFAYAPSWLYVLSFAHGCLLSLSLLVILNLSWSTSLIQSFYWSPTIQTQLSVPLKQSVCLKNPEVKKIRSFPKKKIRISTRKNPKVQKNHEVEPKYTKVAKKISGRHDQDTKKVFYNVDYCPIRTRLWAHSLSYKLL